MTIHLENICTVWNLRSTVCLRLVANDCGFLQRRAVNHHLAHRGCTFRSWDRCCWRLQSALWNPQRESLVFVHGNMIHIYFLPDDSNDGLCGLRYIRREFDLHVASYLYKIVKTTPEDVLTKTAFTLAYKTLQISVKR